MGSSELLLYPIMLDATSISMTFSASSELRVLGDGGCDVALFGTTRSGGSINLNGQMNFNLSQANSYIDFGQTFVNSLAIGAATASLTFYGNTGLKVAEQLELNCNCSLNFNDIVVLNSAT